MPFFFIKSLRDKLIVDKGLETLNSFVPKDPSSADKSSHKLYDLKLSSAREG